jgi:hypothetical protein
MAAQIGDKILYNGHKYSLASEPLSPYLYTNKIGKLFPEISFVCYRGYCATWKIENKNIYILNVESPCSLKKEKARIKQMNPCRQWISYFPYRLRFLLIGLMEN